MKLKILWPALIALSLLASACSSTSLSGSWRNPLFTKRLDTIYIVGMSQQETARRIFEDHFVEGLTARGVTGIPSYRDFPKAKQVSKEIIAEQIVGKKADAILLSQIIGKRTEQVVTPGTITDYSYGPYYGRHGYYRPEPYYRSWPSYYDRSYTRVYEPPTITRFNVVTIESTMYEIKSGEMIWSAQFETVLDGPLEQLLDQFVNTVLGDLQQQGLI